MPIYMLENPTVWETHRFTSPFLTVILAGADGSADPGRGGVPGGKSPQNVVDDNKEDWKSTLSSTAKLVAYAVRETSDAFPPLKSVAGGLCAVLENYEVRYTYTRFTL